MKRRVVDILGVIAVGVALTVQPAFARDVNYDSSEISVYVTPGEPTQIQFPGQVQGGVKRKMSALSLEHKDSDLVVFSSEAITDQGEAIIVRLKDGRSYSVRIRRSADDHKRDDVVRIEDGRASYLNGDESEEPAYRDRKFDYAPPSQVSGLMREMVLVAEFGKKTIAGYRVSDRYRGETVLNDGTMRATIDKIFIGPNLWGYVIDTSNLLDTSQKINPATFRLDGTRAVSATNWELSARPLNVEQQVSSKHTSKVYIVTRARKD